jgi:manganese/zinc/iron transport system substrate-binding protein
MRIRLWSMAVASLLILATVVGCSSPGGGSTGSGKLKVTATIGMIGDVVQNIGGQHVDVTVLMGPGVDPHLYKASAGDIAKMQNAQILFYNGLHLEAKLGDILGKMASSKPTIAVADGIPHELVHSDEAGAYDPHVWFDVTLWMKAASMVRDSLIKADPAHKSDYEQNAASYLKRMEELDQYAKTQLATIPKEQRVMVTAHDAFNYFGRAYNIEVKGLQGINTQAEYGLKDVQNLVNLLVDRKVKAVFVESSVPKRSIEAVIEGAKAKGQPVVIGGELFSDAMGEAGKPEGTYLGMVRHNVDTIVQALK